MKSLALIKHNNYQTKQTIKRFKNKNCIHTKR